MSVVEHKDAVLAILGASAALSGFGLVFLGLTAADVKSYPPGTKKAILDRRRRPGLAVLASFAVGLGCVGVTACWLILSHDNHPLYLAAIWLFGAQLLTLLIATVWSVRRTLWG